MSQRPKHVCFYSNKKVQGGSPSLAFLEELAKTNFSSEFQFISVDVCGKCVYCQDRRPGQCSARAKLPKWLKAVPTLLIDGESDPLIDDDVFNWLSLRKIQEAPASGSRNKFTEPPPPVVANKNDNRSYDPPQYDPNPPSAKQSKFPEPIQTRTSGQASKEVTKPTSEEEPLWSSAELATSNKWSDGYSFIDDQFSIEKGTGSSRFERNFTLLDQAVPEVSKPASQQSEKARVLNSAFDDFRKQRDSDLPGPVMRR
jgi:hypothetical protein